MNDIAYFGAFDEFYADHLDLFQESLEPAALAPVVVDRLRRDVMKDSLLGIGSRTLIQEFLTRFEDRLETADPGASDLYVEFASQLRDASTRRQILDRYPELDRLLARRVVRTAALVIEARSRLENDSALLREHGLHPGELTQVQLSDGDTHNDGHRVLILHGRDGVVVYKPRPVDVDRLVADIADRLSTRSPDIRLLPVLTLPRGAYGWQEHVSFSGCASLDEVRAYYRTAGQWLGIFHALGGTDLHFENLIAAGSHPRFIDLETAIGHVRPDVGDARMTHFSVINQSVIGTMLLPGAVANSVFDISIAGLGTGTEETSEVRRSFDISGLGTNSLSFQSVPIKVADTGNVVSLEGEPQPPMAYADDIEAGYSEASDLLREDVDELTSVLQQNSGAVVRKVLRPTAVYARFIDASLHPDHLTSTAKRRQLLELIKGKNPDYELGSFPRVHGAEIDAMLDLDVPYFSCALDSHDLTANMSRTIDHYFLRPNLANVLEYVQSGAVSGGSSYTESPEGMLNRGLIHGAMVCTGRTPRVDPTLGSRFMADRFLTGDLDERIRAITTYVTAIVRDDEHGLPFWVTPFTTRSDTFVLDKSAPTLMDAGGIAVFLADAGELLEDTSAGELAETYWRDCVAGSLPRILERGDLALFDGLGSYLLLARRFGDVPDAGPVVEAVRRRLDIIAERDLAGLASDFVNGLAGLGSVVAATVSPAGRSSWHGVADRAVDSILAAVAAGRFDGPGELAHGDLGMLLGAAAWLDVLGENDPRTDRVAESSSRVRRHVPERPGWCRGSHGALAASIELQRHLATPVDEIVRMHQPELERLLELDHLGDVSLCHGLAGEADSLLSTVDALGLPELRSTVVDRFLTQTAPLPRTGYRGGLRHSAGVPSYLLGMSGLGHVMVRMQRDSVESLLMPGLATARVEEAIA